MQPAIAFIVIAGCIYFIGTIVYLLLGGMMFSLQY